MSFQDINCTSQRLENKEFRIKFKTGSDIDNAKGFAIAGELFVTTGDAGALYFATETTIDGQHSIYKAGDLLIGDKVL